MAETRQAESGPLLAPLLRRLAKLTSPVFHDPKHHIKIYQGDCLEILPLLPEDSFDLIFADPPDFLSNDGITCHAGRLVSVNKREWDRPRGSDANHEFNRAWLAVPQSDQCPEWAFACSRKHSMARCPEVHNEQ